MGTQHQPKHKNGGGMQMGPWQDAHQEEMELRALLHALREQNALLQRIARAVEVIADDL